MGYVTHEDHHVIKVTQFMTSTKAITGKYLVSHLGNS